MSAQGSALGLRVAIRNSPVSMMKLSVVKDRFAFLGPHLPASAPFRRGLKPRGLGASSPQAYSCKLKNRVPRIHSASCSWHGANYVASERRLT